MRIGRLSIYFLSFGAFALLTSAAQAATSDPLPPVTERFANSDVTEEPSFQRHVSPLFGRLGCNGRSCHGSFQGRGGFRLSLFGYDFQADHEELLKGDPKRANPEKPLESLILVKPTDADMHEGGLRYEKGGWEYHIFRRWLEAGAKHSDKDVQRIVNLEVTPAEIVFSQPGEKVQLKAVAVWPDGTREDVTCLCRFGSNSEQVAKINSDGLVSATDPGDTHLIVAYDSAVISVPAIRPLSQLTGDRYPAVPTPTRIDELVVQKLRKLGEVPSDLCTDAEFLRRVSLDLTGTLPTAADVEQFLADASPTKRADKVEQLLQTPAYAAWWTTRLSDWTGNNDTKFNGFGTLRNGASQQWYDWMYKRIAENMPYDKLVEGMVTAASRNPGESYADFCATMSRIENSGGKETFADRPQMPYFWARNNVNQPQEKAIAFAYSFLGIRIQCAQCHKHPFDQWSKNDFDDFRNFFGSLVNTNNAPPRLPDSVADYNQMLKDLGLENTELRGNQLRAEFIRQVRQGKTVPFSEVYATKVVARPRPTAPRQNGEGPTGHLARVLGGEELDLTKVDDARVPLMDWLRSKNNPYFAKAFVNRVWSNYFNVGIVEPPDDMSLGNPPSNKPLLNYLAEGFFESGYDMKWVHRQICNSRTYQSSWQPNDTNAKDERNFARCVPRRLPAEIAVDAVLMAVASDEKAGTYASDIKGRAIAVASASAARANNNNPTSHSFALQVFGRSIRESNCDCDRSMEASLLQTVFLQNDSAVLDAIDQKTSWIAQISKPEGAKSSARGSSNKGSDPEPEELTIDEPTLIRQVYLRTVGRLPTTDDVDRCQKYLAQSESPVAGAKGLLWTLLNTKEFIVNH